MLHVPTCQDTKLLTLNVYTENVKKNWKTWDSTVVIRVTSLPFTSESVGKGLWRVEV